MNRSEDLPSLRTSAARLTRGAALVAATLLGACATTEPPVTTPPPAATLDELAASFLARAASNARAVDSQEARKEEIVASRRQDQHLLRDRIGNLTNEVESKRGTIATLEQQLGERRTRARQLREQGEDVLLPELNEEIAGLEAEIERERADLGEREAKLRDAAAELRHIAELDDETLFEESMQDLYREGIDLHLGFYRGVIEVTRQQLAGDEAVALIDHFEDRIRKRSALLDEAVEPQAFASLRHEFELDQRMSQAWLAAFILEVRFSLSEYSLEAISEDERHELELLAEALHDSWTQDERLIMLIDGHSDTRKYRGRSDCESATLNTWLSRHRAEAVRDYFAANLGTEPEGNSDRILIDWYGNFAVQEGVDNDELRRIELRITTRREDGGHGSHRGYFAMREGLPLAERSFLRQPGEWVEEGCQDRPADVEHVYLSEEYRELTQRFGLDAAVTVELGGGQPELQVHLGNRFTVVDGELCIAIRPCDAE